MVDALCSGRSVSNHVLVRIQSWALEQPCKSFDLQGFFIFCVYKSVAFSAYYHHLLVKGWLVKFWARVKMKLAARMSSIETFFIVTVIY